MSFLFARRVAAMVKYNNKDISADLNKHLKSLSYTDSLSGEADDLQLTLEDTAGLWAGDWLPDKGATLDVNIQDMYQDGISIKNLPLGLFEVDEIESGGFPSEVTIKAVSIPGIGTLTGVDKNHSWEKAKLEEIAKDIAEASNLKLYYDTEESPVLDRAEQVEQSDLSFLYGLCNNAGLALKVTAGKLCIFDEAKCEAVKPELTIVKPATTYVAEDGMTYNNRFMGGYKFRSKTRDVYAACRVDYQKEKDKEKITYTYMAPDKTGKTLVVNEQVENVAEAERLAKKKLREQNKEEVTAGFTMLGDISLAAGITVNMLGFGKFDGRYIITKANHNFIADGYTTGIEVRKCLTGY